MACLRALKFSLMTYGAREGLHMSGLLANCCIPDDYIDTKRYPLFVARAVMAELVAQLKASGKGAT